MKLDVARKVFFKIKKNTFCRPVYIFSKNFQRKFFGKVIILRISHFNPFVRCKKAQPFQNVNLHTLSNVRVVRNQAAFSSRLSSAFRLSLFILNIFTKL